MAFPQLLLPLGSHLRYPLRARHPQYPNWSFQIIPPLFGSSVHLWVLFKPFIDSAMPAPANFYSQYIFYVVTQKWFTEPFSHMLGNTNKCMDKTAHASLYIFFNYLYSLKQNLFTIKPCNPNKGNPHRKCRFFCFSYFPSIIIFSLFSSSPIMILFSKSYVRQPVIVSCEYTSYPATKILFAFSSICTYSSSSRP